MPTHILSAEHISTTFFDEIFSLAKAYKTEFAKNGFFLERPKKHLGMIVLFYQPSTRTRTSFEIAAHRVNMPVLATIDAAETTSSVAKGESLENTLKNLCYPSVGIIVVRCPEMITALLAHHTVDRYGVSLINGGDGPHEHPTQTFLDAFTISEDKKENREDIRLVFANDVEYSRVFNSSAEFYARVFKPKQIGVCAPKGITLSRTASAPLTDRGIEIVRFDDIADALRWGHYFYVGRPQVEYHPNKEYTKRFEGFQVTKRHLDDLPEDCPCQIMHAQPVSKDFLEITPEAQNHPRCIMMEQKNNGLYIRMALLELLYQRLNNPS